MAIDIKGIADILMGKDTSKRKQVFKKERREMEFSVGALVIVHTSHGNTFDRMGKNYKLPLSWVLGEVQESIKFTEGQGTSASVKVCFLDIPPLKKMKFHFDEWEEWQSNDMWYVPIPQEGEPAFRDYHMMMRLALSNPKTQCPWVKYPVTTVTADLLCDADRLTWHKLMMTR